MKLLNTQKLTIFATFLVAALFTLQACDTTSSDDGDDELYPFGATLFLDGVEIATQEDGAITYNEGDHIELEVGEETGLIQIRWIDEDGNRITPEDDDYSLQWTVADESILEVEQHDEDGPWRFHLVGTAAGETTVEFELFHNDHADFTTLPFEIHVEEVVSGMEVQDESGQSVITVDSNGEVTGSFDVNSGETSGSFSAIFLDENGDAIDTDHDYELEWHLEGSEFATIEPIDGSPFSFTIQGVSAGEAEAHFALIKEGGHDDGTGSGDDHDHEGEIEIYESPDIIINVN
ncbi:MAG: hypothetical protein WD381_05975 [Balneolaceae bacterium]